MTYKLSDYISNLVILLKKATPIRVARIFDPSASPFKAKVTTRRETMTYRTLDTETTFTKSPSAPVRHLRARRRASTLRHRSSGVSLTGFGV